MNISLIVLAVTVAFSFIYGLATRNYSTVDRLWSVLPPVYLILWIGEAGMTPRFLIVFILVLLWGIRLSVNFAVKGGYSFSFSRGFTGEDYRWEVLREKITNRFLFEVFNLLFISGFQLVLIFTFTLPLYFYGQIETPISGLEIFLYALHLVLLTGETAADIQQLRYHRRKMKEPWSQQKRYALGFNTFGLWKISRHPNYVCEMGQWVVVYLYLVAAAGSLHISGIGALVLIALFAGSTNFAEQITEKKYEAYPDWKKLTSVWLPLKSVFTVEKRRAFLE